MIREIPTKSYVDSLDENSTNGQDLSTVFNGQDKEFDKNELTNLESITIIRSPNSDSEVSSKSMLMTQ